MNLMKQQFTAIRGASKNNSPSARQRRGSGSALLRLLMRSFLLSCAPLIVAGQIHAAANAATPSGPTSGGELTKSQRLLLWYQTNAVNAYKKSDFQDPKWNEPVEKALNIFSHWASEREADTLKNVRAMQDNLRKATDLGCIDPLVLYLQLDLASDGGETRDKVIAAWVRVADQIDKSKYPTTFKCRANLQAWNVWVAYNSRNPNDPPPQQADAKRCIERVDNYVKKMAKDKSIPIEIVYKSCNQYLELFKYSPDAKTVYDSLKNDLNQNWPDNAYVSLWRGTFYLDYAWAARGSGMANTISAENWRLFHDRQTNAQSSLEKAWRLDPTIETIPLKMIQLELGLNHGRDRMELWFRRAMAQNTNNVKACLDKLNYLLPQWYGSTREMIAFGRECLASTNWGPDVRWCLIKAHETIATFTSSVPP